MTIKKPEALKLKYAVVIGANGTMGFGSGALLTTEIEHVTFLARTKEKADQALQAAIRQVRSSTVGNRVSTGSYDADFDREVAKADLIFEAVTEIFELKREMFERIDKVRRPDSIVATVTSGLSINELSKGLSESFRKHFMGIHFFNPPNVIVGTELIPGKDADPTLVDQVERFCVRQLGRAIVRTQDTPGFAGNRIGFKVLNECAILAEEHGPLLIDELVGPYTGRALTPLATIDLVGWDIHQAIVDNIYKLAPDEAHETLRMPDYMRSLIAKGFLGRKAKNGFFSKDSSGDKVVLDPKSGNYVSQKSVKRPQLDFVEQIAELHRVGRYKEGMQLFCEAQGEYAKIARRVIAGYISYSFHRVGEVTETIEGIDRIMGWGFNWAPPGALVDLIGKRRAIAMIEEAKLPVPASLSQTSENQRFFTDPNVNVGKFFVAD